MVGFYILGSKKEQQGEVEEESAKKAWYWPRIMA
jgi:hypothetical protein